MAQNPADPIIPYAIWYNQHGENLGWGHLTKKNIKDIRLGMPEDELFMVVSHVALKKDRKAGLCTEKLSIGRLAQIASLVVGTRQVWQKGSFDNLDFEIAHNIHAKTISVNTLSAKLLKLSGAQS